MSVQSRVQTQTVRVVLAGSSGRSRCCVTTTARLCILQHESEALAGIARVQRHVGAAGLEDAEQGHHHVERALDAEPDQHVGSHAQPRR